MWLFLRALYLILNWLSYTLHFLFLIEAFVFSLPMSLYCYLWNIQKGFILKPFHQEYTSPLCEVVQFLHVTHTYPPIEFNASLDNLWCIMQCTHYTTSYCISLFGECR